MKMVRWSWRIVVETFTDFSKDRCSVLAAALAYYALFAMPALLLAGVYLAGTLYGRVRAAGQMQSQLTTVLGANTASAIRALLAGATNGTRHSNYATIAAFGGLTFSALAAVYELQQSLNQAWDVRVDDFTVHFVFKRVLSVLLIVGSAVLLIGSVAVVPALSAVRNNLYHIGYGLLYALDIVVPWAIFTILIAVIMKVLPDAEIEWRDVWLGAGITAALIVVGRFLIGSYLAHSGFNSAYGVAGSIAALLIWAYYSAAILLLGVEFTRVWAREHGRRIQPEKGAVRTALIEKTS